MRISFPSTGLEVSAGFPQTITHGGVLLALVITPPIRTMGDEEYQRIRKMENTDEPTITASSLIDIVFYAQTLLCLKARINGKH